MKETTQPPKDPKKKLWIGYAIILAIVILSNVFLFPALMQASVKSVNYSTFLQMLESKELATVQIEDQQIYFVDKNDNSYKTNAIAQDNNLVTRLEDAGVEFGTVYQPPTIWDSLLNLLISFLPMIILLWLVNRWASKKMQEMGGAGGNAMLFGGKSGAKQYVVDDETGIKFNDVAGEDEAKESLQEIVDFLHNPKKYEEIGAKMPKGVLLVGPPGTGKTLMARAVAGEAGVQFLSISGSDFVELYVGVGASRVRDLFDQAKKVAPAIVFIDEIDAVGRQRGTGLGGGHDEREQTLNQLLVEMDGFTNNEGVIVMAATNRADILDNALLRPGRFDRRVYMGLPDIKGREEILKVHARGKPLGDDVDLKSIARGTAGFAGADLENLLNEAAIMATRSKRRFIMQADIDEAILKVVMGPEKKSRVVSERARRLTAYHESGHAIASFFLKNSDPVHYITIIPRGAAGGFTWYRKAEDAENFTSRGEMFDSIVSALGGRIAEQLFLDDISTGASNDIQQATNIARDMVMKYGMSEKLGPISFDDSSHSIFIGRDFGTTKSYSEETAATIDEEVKHLFDQAYAKCEALLREHADLLTGLAEYLLIHETIEGDDFRYYCEHGVMPVHPDDTIEPPAKVIRRMDEAPVAPQPDAEAPAQPEAPSAPDADAPNSDPGEQP
uniref:ATP-dependent zinc metalloprotease FtsH n=1 Tax=Gemmiger formicilis TaxID=745368 RepID=UPI00402A356D